jgi:hypothetical protein
MTYVAIAVYWALAIWGLCSRRPVLIYLFFCTVPLGSFAVIPPGLTGGLTFVPQPMTALLIIAKTLLHPHRARVAIGAALDPRRLGLFAAYWSVAVITSVFMPRVFSGIVMIVPVRGDLSGQAPLYPTTQNVSQLAYLTVSIFAVFAFTQILSDRSNRQTALQALAAGGVVTVITGMLDFSSQYLPVGPALEIFRTATYALLVDVEVLGAKRVVGLMPEASSYGNMCLSFLCLLYFLRRGIADQRTREFYAPLTILFLLVFAWLSTSSATYVGLAVFIAMASFEWIVRLTEKRYVIQRRRYLGSEFLVVIIASAMFVLIVLFQPTLVDTMFNLIDRMILKKTESSSFDERNMWTIVSLRALLDTFGVGVGLGGTRASNSLVAVASNVGLVGAVLYVGFICQSLLRRAAWNDTEGEVLISAIRYAFVPSFVVSLLIGTSADIGAFGAFCYALPTAVGLGSIYTMRMNVGGMPSLAGQLARFERQ